ncbi:TetR family transcriptional regulator C-terminal domain-containing protein [Limibaculum sp. M0105]|uniref:TetR family transcriptional regulator C-terminal domain-containing protein n=1 Tax=Thermohalobaculum xanthum TaxID=2753746 RepID=A0A8J7SCC7_9RHOB|nr:TetR family transcriptional regulator C-terminal domain-containing protein [Thermohalobaculum xanthum]MBK0398176.1 TetR family transcriptional regulator C-terminal domain-containing protein [Thermohalobaculum xanthum]
MKARTVGGERPQRLTPEDRRRLIIETTIAGLARGGPEHWTLRQVSRDLGVAPSLITYFFSTWSDLLVGAYQELAERFEAQFSEIANRSGLSARDRLDLYIDAFFSDAWMGEDIAGVYVAFWALGRSETRLRAEMERFSDMTRRDLFPLIQEHAADCGFEGDIATVAETFLFLISGLWYEAAVNPGSVRNPGPGDRARSFIDFAFRHT